MRGKLPHLSANVQSSLGDMETAYERFYGGHTMNPGTTGP